MTSPTDSGPRLRVGVVVLLVVITLANVLGLVLVVETWVDEASHGADLGDAELNLVMLAALLSVVALVGIGGAWARRKWGPRLYIAAQAVGAVVLLANGSAGLLTFAPLLLAGLLWWMAERDW